MLKINNLNVNISDKNILFDINLNINPGEVHAIMGPNGSGKSTFSSVLSGNPKYKVISGNINFKNYNLLKLSASERAKRGIFVAFQYPIEIPGVTNKLFLYTAYNSLRKYNNKIKLDHISFNKLLNSKIKLLNISKDFLSRSVNVGFSGGEKKCNDILQMLILKPKLCVLDEIDSGLDIDILKRVSEIINNLRNNTRSFIIITHYRRILDYIKPDFVHVLYNGKFIHSGDVSLVNKLEEKGYGWLVN
ncbi:Fe-S cluster assembly ATPase SufC [Candidatus Purcelliella pentastirinorum]|uniref:Fe-S cluster assembly ATPase SufC n=1 Tax=Candidatus Purcelliella pentastirinorum TaxID=472834 RepID=UPI0023681C18|nr:Fe-S cluster assembly ATPase SufC [Candidatus Purcelliella pentastirinorum]WDI79082.1 Fe-S cluster assembly ATPase SufC [Candidatus Purcelliella pentastirinorum]WDR80220.1 Fe-S cluster assembly ATPase SufC [Candidatus Purcelliella pentastirinorum]